MISDTWILSFPELLETRLELFSIANLQDLLQILVSLENDPPENAEQIFREWCKARRPIRDALRNLASNENRELKKVKPSEPNDSKRAINFFQELRPQVKEALDKLEKQNQSQNN